MEGDFGTLGHQMDAKAHGRLATSPPPLFLRLLRLAWATGRALLVPRASLAGFLVGAVLSLTWRRLFLAWRRLQGVQAEFLWRRHVDFGVVQACVLSTEHLQSLGRVEKRTLFVKPVSEVFRNEYIVARIMEAAEEAANSKDPMLLPRLSHEDKWHVLNMCTNHISSCFAPYHVFFNEARRVKSYYKSAWYCFTLTCAQTEASGRWFITPHRPVGAGDCGSLRIRIVLMNEQELREIAAGTVEAPPQMFNGRHESRWQTCQRFSELFSRQLCKVTGSAAKEDWGSNLCGRVSRRQKVASNVRLTALQSDQLSPRLEAEDNSILRIHIPFPSTGIQGSDDLEGARPEDKACKDVVLFE